MTIRVAIVGLGNLGRGVERALTKNPDMSLVGVFTRRYPGSVATSAPVFPLTAVAEQSGEIDVAILCGGSRTDLPEQGPTLASKVNMIDSFDTHPRIPEYFAAVDRAARAAGTTALISTGWDPGLFSIMRLLGTSALPDGETYTFWGDGVSQGHSDAIRRVPGVVNAIQYTIPAEEALEAVRSGSLPQLSTREKHRRDCYVVAAEGADTSEIERAIVTMPDYFADYDTTVHFISAEQLAAEHSGMPHGGFVLRSGLTSPENRQLMEFRLHLDSNPEFTASVLVAYARAVHRMAQRGEFGAKTVFDIPPALTSPLSGEELRAQLL